MKTIRNFNFKGKRVLVRCDFNVPFDQKGKIAEDFRIKETLPTIKYLIKKRAKIILMSHLGDPQKIEDLKKRKEKFTLKPVAKRLEKLLNKKIIFLQDCLGEKTKKEIEKIKEGEIVLLENLRFYKEEEENDENFSKKIAELGDFYVNEAFSVCHRAHASIVGVTKFLPAMAGFLLKKEIKILSKILEKPQRPLIVMIGGAKISSKMGVISQFLKKADYLLLGGQIANTVLAVKGTISNKIIPEDEKIIDLIREIDIKNPKIYLPVDGAISFEKFDEKYFRIDRIENLKKDETIYDIGPQTIKNFSEILKKGKTIFWSGPFGFFEHKKFETGTKKIAQAIISNKKAFKVVGGGDTILAINKFGFLKKFNHVSTGGGAMLEFLSQKILPGIEVLK